MDESKDKCPICKNQGMRVKKTTVEHLVIEDKRYEVEGDSYRICMNESCDVVYYNEEYKSTFMKNEIKVPIWFKKDADPKYACYCAKVTEEQVIEAVLKGGARTVKEVNNITEAMKNSNCIENNPLGTCCNNIIQKVIDDTI